jgi:hypothetical protein
MEVPDLAFLDKTFDIPKRNGPHSAAIDALLKKFPNTTKEDLAEPRLWAFDESVDLRRRFITVLFCAQFNLNTYALDPCALRLDYRGREDRYARLLVEFAASVKLLHWTTLPYSSIAWILEDTVCYGFASYFITNVTVVRSVGTPSFIPILDVFVKLYAQAKIPPQEAAWLVPVIQHRTAMLKGTNDSVDGRYHAAQKAFITALADNAVLVGASIHATLLMDPQLGDDRRIFQFHLPGMKECLRVLAQEPNYPVLSRLTYSYFFFFFHAFVTSPTAGIKDVGQLLLLIFRLIHRQAVTAQLEAERVEIFENLAKLSVWIPSLRASVFETGESYPLILLTAFRTRSRACVRCGTSDKACKVCSRCKEVRYCGTKCQRSDWVMAHKDNCGRISLLDLLEAVLARPPPDEWAPPRLQEITTLFDKIFARYADPDWKPFEQA